MSAFNGNQANKARPFKSFSQNIKKNLYDATCEIEHIINLPILVYAVYSQYNARCSLDIHHENR